MAESTKTKGSKRSTSGKARGSGRAKVKKPAGRKSQKPAAKETKSKATEAASEAKSKATEAAKELPAGAAASAALAGKAAMEGTRAAGMAISLAASKVKVPLAVGGGLAAGAAGGLALVRRNGHRRRSGPDLGPVISAAKHAGSIGEELGRLAAAAEKATTSKVK